MFLSQSNASLLPPLPPFLQSSHLPPLSLSLYPWGLLLGRDKLPLTFCQNGCPLSLSLSHILSRSCTLSLSLMFLHLPLIELAVCVTVQIPALHSLSHTYKFLCFSNTHLHSHSLSSSLSPLQGLASSLEVVVYSFNPTFQQREGLGRGSKPTHTHTRKHAHRNTHTRTHTETQNRKTHTLFRQHWGWSVINADDWGLQLNMVKYCLKHWMLNTLF